MSEEQLGIQKQQGQIAVDNTKAVGNAYSDAIKGGVDSYYQGKKIGQESRAADAQNSLSEEELRGKQRENKYQDSASSEEGLSNFAYGKAMGNRKTQAEIDKMEAEAQKARAAEPKTASAWRIAPGVVNDKGEALSYNEQTNEQRWIPGSASSKPVKSPGEEQLDKKFAEDLNSWETSGRTAANANIQQLQKVKAQLDAMDKAKQDVRVPFFPHATASTPDALRFGASGEKAIQIRDDVQKAAMAGIKAIFPRVTQNEAQMFLSKAYNENLSPAENSKKIDAALAELQANAGSMEDRARQFRAGGGSLKGYTPPPSVAAAPPPGPGSANAGPQKDPGDMTEAELDAYLAAHGGK